MQSFDFSLICAHVCVFLCVSMLEGGAFLLTALLLTENTFSLERFKGYFDNVGCYKV